MILNKDLMIYDNILTFMFATCQDCWKLVPFGLQLMFFSSNGLSMRVSCFFYLIRTCHLSGVFLIEDLHFHICNTPGQIEVPAVNAIETEGLLAKTFFQVIPTNVERNNLENVGEIFDTPGLHGFATSALGTL